MGLLNLGDITMAGGASSTDYPQYIRNMHLMAFQSKTTDKGDQMNNISEDKNFSTLFNKSLAQTNPYVIPADNTYKDFKDGLFNPANIIRNMQELLFDKTGAIGSETYSLKTPGQLLDNDNLEDVKTGVSKFNNAVTQDITKSLFGETGKDGLFGTAHQIATERSNLSADTLYTKLSGNVNKELIDTLKPKVQTFITSMLENVQDINPSKAVSLLFEEILTIVDTFTSNRITKYKSIFSNAVESYKAQVEEDVAVFEQALTKRQQRSIGRTLATLGKNGVYSGTAMANAVISAESENLKEINKFQLELVNKFRDQLFQIFMGESKVSGEYLTAYANKSQVEVQQYLNITSNALTTYMQTYLESVNQYTNMLRVQLADYLEFYKTGATIYADFEKYKLTIQDKNVTDLLKVLLEGKNADITRVEQAKQLAIELHKMSIIANAEFYDKKQEFYTHYKKWEWDRFTYLQNFLSAPSGISPVTGKPSKLQSTLANASTGAMVGAQIGSMIPGAGPIGTATGTAIGTLIGIGTGLLGE